MANYVKFKQGLKKDFNTTNQPLTNGMIYFVIDENNHGSIYYDTIVDGKKATKNGTVHRVKFSGLPIKITGSVIGTGVISQDGETIEINTSTNHSHGLAHQDFTVTLSNDDTNLKWTRLGNQNGGGFWLKSIRGQTKAPAWFLPDFSAGIAFGGSDTKGIISVRYSQPSVRFAGGNGDAPVWYFTITGANDKTYDLNGIGGHSSDSAKLDHNVTFKIASTADATKGGNGTATNLSGSAVDLYLPTRISGFDLLQATRFQGNADTSTVAAKLGRGGNTSLPMTFNWNGQGGQPTWLWGGENGTDMYVYNPSNFRVAHSVNTAGLDHNITFKISKIADATIGETGITTKLTENAITFTIPSDLSGFNNIQSTRFQGTADNADTVDYFHVDEEKYKYETTKTQPTSGADWCIKISTSDWNSTSETIYLRASGNNTNGTVILKTGSRQNNWWGYATNYNGTGIIGVYKLVSNSDDVYIKVNGAYTSVRIRTTFNPTISIPATIPDYKFTSVPYQGGFFSNAIYTDNLTFTTPKYWANVPISDNSKTDTQPTFNTAYVSNWWRSTGNTGWWNETHRGGITMEDDTYVKVAGYKSFLIPSGFLWIQGGSEAGSDLNRLTTTSGMPGNMQYYQSRRGTQIYANGIAFCDPYNGNNNNDSGWIRQVETSANSGYLEMAVGDDGNESIYVRQYNTSNNIVTSLTLLDANHNTTIPNALTVGTTESQGNNYKFYVNGTSYLRGTTIIGEATAGTNHTLTLNGHMVINPSYNTSNSYSEGIRINKDTNNWSVIALGGDVGSTSGTNAKTWLIGDYDGTFYLSLNGSDSAATRFRGSGNGFIAYPRLGVNGENTSYNFYVNGTSRFNNTLYFFNSTGNTDLSIESRRSKNSSNANIEINTGLVTKNKSFIEIRGFAPPTMVRTTGDRPAPYGLGFGNGSESAGIMPIGEGDNLRELMFYGANSGPTLFTWKYQTWESTSYDTNNSNGYSAAMMSLNSKTGDLYVKNTIGINGTNTLYNFYVNGTSYFNNRLTIESTSGGPYLTVNYGNRYDSDKTLDNYGINLIKFGMSSMDNYLGTSLNGQTFSGKYAYTFHTGSSYSFGWFTSGWTPVMELECNTGDLRTKGNIYLGGGTSAYINSTNYTGSADKVDGLHATDFVRAYTTSNDNIDADWGQSFKTFDPIPTGTPPEQNPNISLLSIGNAFNRRKMFAFMYNNDNIYYRRRIDGNFSSWVKLLHTGNYNSYSPTLTGGGASGTWGINISGNADTTDGVHLEWSGEQAASATEWIAGWTADGKKIKAVRRSALATKNSDIAAKLGQNGNVAIPMTFYWNGQGGQPNWIWGGNDGTNMYVYSPSNFSVSNAGYIRSMGNQEAESGRTAARGGVYTYNMYDQTANGAPATYLSVIGFGNGVGGHIEIAGQWVGNSNLWMRGLRDCCDDWYSWNRIWCQGNSVTGAVWNDYAECRQSDCSEPGRVVFEKGNDTLTKTEKRLQHFAGVISDTWGFSQGETDKAKTNIAVAGRVLVYTYQDRNNYKPGDCVCAAPNGTIDIMTREEIIKFPDRIVGTVSCVPDYEEWGGGKNADRDPVKVNGRIWIKVK